MYRIPLFVWAIYSTAILQVLATPVLAITLLLLAAEKAFGVGIFNPDLGEIRYCSNIFSGSIRILPCTSWFYRRWIISEVIYSIFAKTIFGYTAIAYSSLGIAGVHFLYGESYVCLWSNQKWREFYFHLSRCWLEFRRRLKCSTGWRRFIVARSAFNHRCLCVGIFVSFCHRRCDRNYACCLGGWRTFPRHVLRGRPFPLRDGGWNLDGLDGGDYYWFPKMFGKMYSESGGST